MRLKLGLCRCSPTWSLCQSKTTACKPSCMVLHAFCWSPYSVCWHPGGFHMRPRAPAHIPTGPMRAVSYGDPSFPTFSSGVMPCGLWCRPVHGSGLLPWEAPAMIAEKRKLFFLFSDGSWVLPEQVVGPDQPGRKICMLGVTDSLLSALPWVQAADAIVLGADTQVLRTTLA